MEEEESKQPTEEGTSEPEQIVDNTQMIADTNAAAERLEKATAEMKATIEQQKALRVEATLAGTTTTNNEPQKTADQRADAAAKEMLAGTGFGEELFPDA